MKSYNMSSEKAMSLFWEHYVLNLVLMSFLLSFLFPNRHFIYEIHRHFNCSLHKMSIDIVWFCLLGFQIFFHLLSNRMDLDQTVLYSYLDPHCLLTVEKGRLELPGIKLFMWWSELRSVVSFLWLDGWCCISMEAPDPSRNIFSYFVVCACQFGWSTKSFSGIS